LLLLNGVLIYDLFKTSKFKGLYMISAVHPAELSAPFIHYRETSETAVSIMKELRSVSTSRAGMRRLRKETPARLLIEEPVDLVEQLNALYLQFRAACIEGRYSEAFAIFCKIRPEIFEFVSEILLLFLRKDRVENLGAAKAGIELFLEGASDLIESYLLALSKDRRAGSLSDEGYEKFRSGWTMFSRASCDFEEKDGWFFDNFYHLIRGLIAISLQDRDTAICHLKMISEKILDGVEDDFSEYLYLIKILEQKLGASLVDLRLEKETPLSFFLKGRYEEALSLLPTFRFEEEYEEAEFRAACYSMLGRQDEALSLITNGCSSDLKSLIYFQNGNIEMAKKIAIENENDLFLFLLLLLQ
jgi:tetratricopeptide (TPR) repeat protein